VAGSPVIGRRRGAFSTLLASSDGVLSTKSERIMLASTCLYSLYAWFIFDMACGQERSSDPLDGIAPERAPKLLCVIFTGKLSFEDRVNFVLTVCSQRVYLIVRSQGLSTQQLHMVFMALILSRVTYLCTPSLGRAAYQTATRTFGSFLQRRNARIASAVLATAIPSVCPSVCLSVTRWYCVKTTVRSTVQFALSDSKMCLVL